MRKGKSIISRVDYGRVDFSDKNRTALDLTLIPMQNSLWLSCFILLVFNILMIISPLPFKILALIILIPFLAL